VAELDGLDAGAQDLGVALDERVDLGGAAAWVLRPRAAVAFLDDVHGAHAAFAELLGEEASVSVRQEPTRTFFRARTRARQSSSTLSVFGFQLDAATRSGRGRGRPPAGSRRTRAWEVARGRRRTGARRRPWTSARWGGSRRRSARSPSARSRAAGAGRTARGSGGGCAGRAARPCPPCAGGPCRSGGHRPRTRFGQRPRAPSRGRRGGGLTRRGGDAPRVARTNLRSEARIISGALVLVVSPGTQAPNREDRPDPADARRFASWQEDRPGEQTRSGWPPTSASTAVARRWS